VLKARLTVAPVAELLPVKVNSIALLRFRFTVCVAVDDAFCAFAEKPTIAIAAIAITFFIVLFCFLFLLIDELIVFRNYCLLPYGAAVFFCLF
jgi:hypothetical protein